MVNSLRNGKKEPEGSFVSFFNMSPQGRTKQFDDQTSLVLMTENESLVVTVGPFPSFHTTCLLKKRRKKLTDDRSHVSFLVVGKSFFTFFSFMTTCCAGA